MLEAGLLDVVAFVTVIHFAVILVESLNRVFELVEALCANVDQGNEQERCPVVIIRYPSHALECCQAMTKNATLSHVGINLPWRG
jgi:hypothetical protein